MEGAHGGQSVSTLMDGELIAFEADREIARLKSDSGLREQWDTYHVIGDAIRGSHARHGGFAARFSERLAIEPTVLAPRARTGTTAQTFALRAAASVAAVAVVGWAALNIIKPTLPGAEMAQNSAAPAVVAGQHTAVPAGAVTTAIGQSIETPSAPAQPASLVAVPAEPVNEYLMAHQGISPTTAIQGVAPYVRTVSNAGE